MPGKICPALQEVHLFMLHVALLEPEIAGNVGNIARTCLATGAQLHLIRPLGFRLSDEALRRAGMDYWHEVEAQLHPSFARFAATFSEAFAAERVFSLSTKGRRAHSAAAFRAGDVLLFGPESRGLPAGVLDTSHVLRIPMTPGARSLNLATSVGVCVYEAWRQLNFAHLEDGRSP